MVMFGGEAVAHEEFDRLIHDFALLHSLGIRLVLVHGANPQIETALHNANLPNTAQNGVHITPPRRCLTSYRLSVRFAYS